MKISWRLVAFGIVAFFIFLVATVPAEFVLSRMSKQGVSAAGVTGSLWNGRASVLQVGSTQLGAVTWNVRLLSLLIGKLSADVDIKRDDGSAKASVAVGFSKSLQIRDLQGSLPVAALRGLGLPGGGWQGEARLRLAHVQLKNNIPVAATGIVDVLNLVGPANQPAALGSFRLEYPAPPIAGEGLIGNLTSQGEGPIAASGKIKLLPNRTYSIEGLVKANANAPASIVNAMKYLPPPDSEGRRPFAMQGIL